MRIAEATLLAVFVLTVSSCARSVDPVAEQSAIRDLFERHRLALESKDVAAVGRTFDHVGPLAVFFGEGEPMTDWPSVERAYREWFASAGQLRMKDTCLQVRVHPSGLAAWASYLTDEAESTLGTSRPDHLRATFGLEKHGPTWVVVQAHWSVATGSR
jgi:ketosteroid isomerase-like protein